MIHRCNWCGKEIDWKKQGLPPGWRKLEYDAIKYTEEFDEATVCSLDCEVRLDAKVRRRGLPVGGKSLFLKGMPGLPHLPDVAETPNFPRLLG